MVAVTHAGLLRLGTRRRAGARAAALVGAASYNWWIAVPFLHGLLPSIDSFFSDLEVKGARDASIFGHLDVVAGALFLVALALAPRAADGRILERRLFVVFAMAVGAGGFFPFSCAEGTNPVCRRQEWHFQLPADHYLHVAFSAVEFLTVSVAILVAWRATRTQTSFEATAFRWIALAVVVGYVPLAIAYFSDRDAALVEPVFFALFTAAVLTEVFTPTAAPSGP